MWILIFKEVMKSSELGFIGFKDVRIFRAFIIYNSSVSFKIMTVLLFIVSQKRFSQVTFLFINSG